MDCGAWGDLNEITAISNLGVPAAIQAAGLQQLFLEPCSSWWLKMLLLVNHRGKSKMNPIHS